MKAHKLQRLLSSIYGKPLLISKSGFQSISGYLNSRNAQLMVFPNDNEEIKLVPAPIMDENSGISVIEIRGPLTYRTSGWEALCGGYSYEMLLEDAAEAIESGSKTIVIDCDSGGGEAFGCFESADELRKMCDDNGVTLYGYVDGSACSAMYGIICVCDEVIANPMSEVGSIGVLIALYNDSKALEMEGYERIFITDGTDKVPFDSNGQFKDSFLEDLQRRVSELGDEFRDHVSQYTQISVEDLKKTQAKVYNAEDALSMGFINKIQTRSEFVSYVLSNQGAT